MSSPSSTTVPEPVLIRPAWWNAWIVAPLVGLVFGVIGTGAIDANFADEGAKWPVVFLPIIAGVVATLFIVLGRRQGWWTLRNGVLHKGPQETPLLTLDDVVATRLGLPEDWPKVTAAMKAVPHRRIRGAAEAAEAVNSMCLVVQLTGGRWFVWNGIHYAGGGHVLRALEDASDETLELDDIPKSIRRKLSANLTANRILHE